MKKLLALLLSPLAALSLKTARLSQLWAFALAKRQCASVADSAVLMGRLEVHGTGQIDIGGNTLFYPGTYLETRGQAFIRIGDGVVCSRGVHIAAHACIEIGQGTMIGEYTSIRDSNHSKPAPGKNLRDSGHDSRPIRIGIEVWIGRGAVILPGVTIGDRAVVAANAVVREDVPAGALVGGVPARMLRKPADVVQLKSK